MNVYLACGLTHVPRDLFSGYVEYLHGLADSVTQINGVSGVKYALINSDPQLAEKPMADRPALCYAWDRRMVEEADFMIADASFPSTGLGIEMQIADSKGIPILMLIGDFGVNRVKPVHYLNPDSSEHDLQVGEGIVSLMALGIPSIRKKIEYNSYDSAIKMCIEETVLFASLK